jgi:hypothetical protein
VNDTELLRKLLSYFYQDRDELHWGYVEGQSVGRATYLVESLTNIGALSVGPTKMVRVGDTVTSAEVDYVCERSRAEVFIRN